MNNFHIAKHLRTAHNHAAAPTLPCHTQNPTLASVQNPVVQNERDHPEWAASCSDDSVSLPSSDTDGDDEHNTDMVFHEDEDDEAAITVEDYLRDLTDATYRVKIAYNAKTVLKYLSWKVRPLTMIEHEAIRFLRCASFGNGQSKAHANLWLSYVSDFGGRAALLPKTVDTVWRTIEQAHRDMSDSICRKTLVVDIPTAVTTLFTFKKHYRCLHYISQDHLCCPFLHIITIHHLYSPFLNTICVVHLCTSSLSTIFVYHFYTPSFNIICMHSL